MNEDLFKEDVVREINEKGFLRNDIQDFNKDFLNCVLTRGFKTFCEENKCYWFFSDTAVILMDRIKDKEDFIVINLLVKNKKAYLKLYSDYSKEDIEFNKQHLLYEQNYNYTDMKEGTYSFYAVKNELNTYTFMEKEEY